MYEDLALDGTVWINIWQKGCHTPDENSRKPKKKSCTQCI